MVRMGQAHKSGLNTAAVKTRKNFLAYLTSTAVVLATALPFSYSAHALNIGEVVSQSRIGEPLRTQIELIGSGDETIENSCLSLLPPDANEEGAREFVTAARLAVKTEGKRQFAVISSHRPYNDPFLRIRLRVRCVGIGSVVRTFTILPEFVEMLPVAAPVVAAPAGSAAAAGSAGAARDGATGAAAPSVAQDVLPESLPAPPRRSKHRSRTTAERGAPGEARRSSPARSASGGQDKTESVRLRLSTGALDETRIGKISPEERSLLLARQKLLDADDQMASFLALQNQVKQLQAELGMVKLRLGQLGASAPAAAPPLAAAQPAPAAAPVQETLPPPAQPQPVEAAPQPENAQVQQAQNQPAQNLHPVKRKPRIQRGPIIFGLLILLGVLLGLRYFLRIRTQSVRTKPVLKRPSLLPDDVAGPAPAHAPVAASPTAMQPRIAQPGPKPAAKPAAKPVAAKPRASVSEQAPAMAFPAARQPAAPSRTAPLMDYEKTPEELAEADSIIEEAELYAIHGHPDRAVLILKELLQQHAQKTEAWLLLFSIYSSLKKAPEFERAAQDFLRANKNSAVWPEIQALGRSLDAGNLLYIDISAAGSKAPEPQAILGRRALLGDILLAMGALSIQDMDKCLSEFDPKADGRFGGFLIKRNMITEAQLDAALLQQQLNNEANAFQAEDTPTRQHGMLPDLSLDPPELGFPKTDKAPDSK